MLLQLPCFVTLNVPADFSLLALRLQADNNKGFRHFNPSFKGSDPSLETASRINAAFVFQKQGAASEHLPVKAAGTVGEAWYRVGVLSSRKRQPVLVLLGLCQFL